MRAERASRSVAAAIAAALVVLAPAITMAEPIAAGAGRVELALGAETLEVFTYRPRCSDPALLVVLHGQGRNADGYRDYARPLADRLCLLVAAPRFDRKRFPQWRYQHGGIVRDGVVQPATQWTARMIDALVVWGGESEVLARLREVPSFGVGELLAMPILASGDREALPRTLAALGKLAAE